MGKVQDRVSYSRWRKMAEFLKTKPSDVEIMKYVDSLLNEMHAYGSMQAAGYAAESLEEVIKEDADGRSNVLCASSV